jgi:hypothetical protein
MDDDPLKTEVTFGEDYWTASVEPDYCEAFEGSTLEKLTEVVRASNPEQSLLFVVDEQTIEGNPAAQAEFMSMAASDPSIVGRRQTLDELRTNLVNTIFDLLDEAEFK